MSMIAPVGNPSSPYFHSSGIGCTDAKIFMEDGTPVNIRNLDFIAETFPQGIKVPRGELHTSRGPNDSANLATGYTWQSKWGFFGINAFGGNNFIHCENEKGLSIASNTLDATVYETVYSNETHLAVSVEDVPMCVAGMCETIEEAKTLFREIRVWGGSIGPLSNPKQHFQVHDRFGASCVFEYLPGPNGQGELVIVDNRMGIMTNDPPQNIQRATLSWFNNLSTGAAPDVTINGEVFPSPGIGSQMNGLLAGYSSPARFVKAATGARVLKTPKDENELIQAFEDILTSVNVPYGFKAVPGTSNFDRTIWSVGCVLKELGQVFYKHRFKQVWESFDLSQLDFSETSERIKVPLYSNKAFVLDRTSELLDTTQKV